MKKLIEGLPFYQDKLHNEVVYTRFSEILAKVGGSGEVVKSPNLMRGCVVGSLEQVHQQARFRAQGV